MSKSIVLFLPLEVKTLESLVEAYQEEFNVMLEESFSDEELEKYQYELDSLGAVSVSLLSDDLRFEDFYPSATQYKEQQLFFERARSCLTLENLPYLESNPFQVSYLQDLLSKFDEVLIDRGGPSELIFKEEFLEELKSYKNINSLFLSKISQSSWQSNHVKKFIPVDPIDFVVLDVYKEIDRLRGVELNQDELSQDLKKILYLVKKDRYDSATLYQKSGLPPKDFDDSLEKLKFWLRKIF